MSDSPIETLIAKYFARETSSEENQVLLSWVQESTENQEIFNAYQEAWKNSFPKEGLVFNQTKAQEKIKRYLQAEKRANRKIKRRNYLKLAASIILILGISSIWFYQQSLPTNTITRTTEFGQRMKFSLPDGSVVSLNAGSTLSYPAHFSNSERTVSLKGEAFFQVKRNEQKPFKVISQQLTTTVLGTSFNINAFDSIESSVTVVSGKVKVENSYQSMVLIPNHQVRLINGALKREKVNALQQMDWTQGVLRFEDSKLKNVIESLERWYGVSFTLENKAIEECKFTGQFKNEKLLTVLKVLEEALGITYEVNSTGIIIKGKGC